MCPRRESDLNGSRVELTSDVSAINSPDIVVPDCLIKEIEDHIQRMGTVKIQFGLCAEFIKEDGEIKKWCLSNKAITMSSSFINDGIEKLKEKLEKYTQQSSGWRIHKILEVTMILTKLSDIIHVSGKFIYIIIYI